MEITITTIRKLVPQRGWKVVNCCAFSTVTGLPDSKLKTTLCSAPWYSKTRRMSFKRETQVQERQEDRDADHAVGGVEGDAAVQQRDSILPSLVTS